MKVLPIHPKERGAVLVRTRNLKMSRSAHAYVRGNTVQFYEWLRGLADGALPDGPPVWICGDCHVGNLGPLGNSAGQIGVQIRDLDQTVIGNPAHDLIRLGLSLASAARGSDLPGVTTARMLEQMMEGYEAAFEPDFHIETDVKPPKSVSRLLKEAASASWVTLAEERIADKNPTIPLGRKFWPISHKEKEEIGQLFADEELRKLATIMRSRDDGAKVRMVDAAYWMKGCSSLGRLRYAVLLEIAGKKMRPEYCLMDLKEASEAAAPRAETSKMPADHAERVVEGARHLSPYLGKRMRAVKLMHKSVFVRELAPQDLKIEIEQLTPEEAMGVAHYLAAIVGLAHSRQMDGATRTAWRKELRRNRSKTLDAPTWLWSSVVDLLVDHERAYLEHCRKHALAAA
jgi:uncharacterized protein (DUF2252 family)